MWEAMWDVRGERSRTRTRKTKRKKKKKKKKKKKASHRLFAEHVPPPDVLREERLSSIRHEGPLRGGVRERGGRGG